MSPPIVTATANNNNATSTTYSLDGSTRQQLALHQNELKNLILANAASLQELSFNGTFLEGSIGCIISKTMGFSGLIRDSFWEENEHDFVFPQSSNPQDDEYCRTPPGLVEASESSDLEGSALVEVAPTNASTATLRSPTELWQAIREGRTIITTCQRCRTDLHGIDDAQYVVCPNCWVATPVKQQVGGILLEADSTNDEPVCRGMGMGVTRNEVVAWLESNHGT